MNIYRRLDSLLKKKPFYNLVLIVVFMAIIQVFLNLIKQRSILHNMGTPILIGGMYFIAWVLSKLKINSFLRFILAFLISFSCLSVQMFFDKSYVDYTSFLVAGGVSIFIASMIMLVVFFLRDWRTKYDK